MNVINLIGWIGFIFVILFYWLITTHRIVEAYICGIVGTVAFLTLSIGVQIGYVKNVPSLLSMQVMVLILNIRGYVLSKRILVR